MTNKLSVYAAVFVVLAFSFICSVDAEAVLGQRYFGDGSTPDLAGGWSYASPKDSSCFACHTPSAAAPDKTSYLKTGHRNALRKATVNSFWSGPDWLTYDTDLSGRGILWNTPGPISLGTSTQLPPRLDGSCSLSGYPDQSACQSAGGTWTSGSNSLFYIYGGWMNAIAGAGAFNDPNTSVAAPGAVSSGGSYSCARCHTTGMTFDTAVSTTRQPERMYPTINNYVNFDPDGDGPAITVSWATAFSAPYQSLEGVQCERCHDATSHFSGSGVTIPRGVDATALCLQCHRQERTATYAGGGRGANIHPTAFSDNGALPISEPTCTLPAIEVGRTDGSYARVFFGYSTGMEYLNGVHGRFTGNFQQINDLTKYNSTFSSGSCDQNGFWGWDQETCASYGGSWSDARGCILNQTACEANSFGTWTVSQGGCTTCHDVHNSLFVSTQAQAALRNTCSDCHVNNAMTGATVSTAPQVKATFNHPKSAGTPFDNTLYEDSCAVCHMATQAVANGDQVSMPAHIWRINTDASYKTFPTADQFNGTNGATQDRTAQIAPEMYVRSDGTFTTYAKAVWVDLDLACGQCHGGSLGSGATHNHALYFNKSQLSSLAKDMHQINLAAGFTWSNDPSVSYGISFDASAACPTGAACSYSWSFGDGSAAGTGATPSHTYADAIAKTVTLTMALNGAIDSASLTVLPKSIPTPVVVNPPTVSINGLTATVTDNSSGGDAPITVLVNWGDGTSSQGSGHGAVLIHSYAAARTYAAKITVSGSTGSNYANFSVTVTPLTVSGYVYRKDGVTPISGALVTLKVGTVGKYVVTTNTLGQYTVPNVAPATYTMIPSKSGYTFNPATVVVTNVNMTQNFSATNL